MSLCSIWTSNRSTCATSAGRSFSSPRRRPVWSSRTATSSPASARGPSSSAWARAPPRPNRDRGIPLAAGAERRSTTVKILFTKRAYARVGGSESLAYQFATRLAARGHDVRVVCAQAFDDRRVFGDQGVEVVQVKPRGGFLGLAADATTLVDLMRTDVLEWYAEDRELVHNIGRKERYKGYIHLLDAAELVWRRHPDARFVFIGIPGFYSSFFDEFARYADERIVDIERATGAEKSAALDACDVFAMPSLHETFGIGYLEAWLHERPVVGGDIPPLRDVIADGDDGFCVRQRVNDVARAIMRLLDDPALRLTMGRAGAAKLRERWDWDQVIARVEDAYARALANAHSDVDEALA